MADYPFWCDCGKSLVIKASIHNYPKDGQIDCPSCGLAMHRDFSGIGVDIFEPFTDPYIADKPVHFSSRKERDTYLKSEGLTYDSAHWTRRPVYKPASASITLDDVMKELHENGPPKQEFAGADDGPDVSESVSLDD